MAQIFDEMGNVIGEGDDVTYDAPNPLQLDYYRGKLAEFQSMLYGLDRAARVAYDTQSDPSVDAVTYARIGAWLNDYENKRVELRAAVSATNAAVQAANFFGANLQTINRPATLGLAPIVIPAAVIAVLAALTVWGVQGIQALKEIIIERARTADLTPEQRVDLEKKRAELEAAKEQASSSPFGFLAGPAKWLAIAGVAFVAWKMWNNRGR